MLPRTFVIASSMTLVFILSASAQEKLVGTYGEARASLAFKIPDATAQSMLPRGWLKSALDHPREPIWWSWIGSLHWIRMEGRRIPSDTSA